MGICAANMKECDKKTKCLFGPNEGEAYNPKNPCCGVGTFDESICDCTEVCVAIYTVVELVDGKSVSSGVACSNEYCSDPLILCNDAPLTGFDPEDISVVSFYSPATCGITTRGALVGYRFPALCDGEVDDLARTYQTVRSNGTDIQPIRADVYLAPSPLPPGCTAPAPSARRSEGLSQIPDCFTLVTSAVNTATDRIVCP